MTWVFWLYAGIAAPWALCALFYGLRSHWWLSATGWGQFVTYLSLAAALGLAAALRAIHPPRVVAVVVAIIVLGLVGAAGLFQLVNVVRLQQQDRRR